MTGKRLRRNQILASGSATILVIILVATAYGFGLFSRSDNFLYDLNYRWRGPRATSGRVTLVLMDDQSAVDLKRKKGNWSRKNLALALNNLCRAGAEIVGIDLILSAADPDPEADDILTAAMARCNNVVLARVSSAPGAGEINPLPRFQEATIGDGFIDLPLDPDDVLRKVRFFNAKTAENGGLQLLPSFSLELSRTFLNLDFTFDFSDPEYFVMGAPAGDNLRLPYPDLLINYYGDLTAFTNLRYSNVVKNHFDPAAVRGRIVILGSTMISQKDYFSTPYSRFQRGVNRFADKFGKLVDRVLGAKEPGVACHAHAIETILNKTFITTVSRKTTILFICLLGLAGLVFHISRNNMAMEITFLLVGVFGVLTVSCLLLVKANQRLDSAGIIYVLVGQFVAGTVLQKAFSRKKSSMVTNLFGKYVSAGVVNEIIRGDLSATLEGRRAELTMLFSDLRGFTTLSERLGARDTGILLNRYFDTMIPIVFEQKGTLDKLMGDAIMAFFGAPLELPDHPQRGAVTALTMMKKLAELKRNPDIPGVEELNIGIGLNTGEVTVGNLGSNVFMDYTIVGDAVNLASRLEGLNKVYGTNIIISEFTAANLDPDRFITRELDLVKVKGKEKAVRIFELVGFAEDVGKETRELIADFERGLAAYRKQEWDRAETLFRKAAAAGSKEQAAVLYLERIAMMRQQPPGGDWDGVTAFDHK